MNRTPSNPIEDPNQRRKLAAALLCLVLLSIEATGVYTSSYYNKTPYHTSALIKLHVMNYSSNRGADPIVQCHTVSPTLPLSRVDASLPFHPPKPDRCRCYLVP
jgi:hypothetical protein